MSTVNNYKAVIDLRHNKVPVIGKSILVGLLTGVLINLYRITLLWAEDRSWALYAAIRERPLLFFAVLPALAAAGLLTGFLLTRQPLISGSGIPQVKGTIQGHFQSGWLPTLLAKFAGGALCLLAGLSLGREGPSIQLGASLAEGMGLRLAATRTERKILIAAGASAGLAAAFNAPLAGTIFALEEIFRYFSPVILLSTMVSAMAADMVSKLVFGMSPVFDFGTLAIVPLESYWMLLVLGALLGAGGAFYNFALLGAQRLYRKLPLLYRPVLPFLLAGAFGFLFPLATGSGHRMMDEFRLSAGLLFLLVLLLAKFAFSVISFGSGAPGGIFFPMLMLGAAAGSVFGYAAVHWGGATPGFFTNAVVLSMAGLFTAIVRAPITGIILMVEMTGAFTHLLPLTAVAVTAYIVADLLKSAPIYESLLENLLRTHANQTDDFDTDRKVTIEAVVHHGSAIEGRCIRDLELPRHFLLIALRRRGKEIIPRGDTKVLAEDHLVVLTDLRHEAEARRLLASLTEAF